ncbi:MAG: hypothetical protein BGO39_05120 [Chloroflexi bacterium 54-19]|nr:MAG: hypothetical protein BGO39_05120 [Chloroflexi bacterium 54-19]
MLNSVAKPVGKKPAARPERKIPTFIDLPCGCRYSPVYLQVTHMCPVARQLFQTILAGGPYIPADDENPRTRAYSEHITSGLELLELETDQDTY